MPSDLMTRIEDLKRLIESTDTPLDVKAVKEWGGADVIIKSRLDAHTEKWLRDQPVQTSRVEQAHAELLSHGLMG